jgi:hypothetical protein
MSFDRAFTLKNFIVSSDGYQLNEFVVYKILLFHLMIINLTKLLSKIFYCFI